MGKHEWARTAELEFGLHMFVFAILLSAGIVSYTYLHLQDISHMLSRVRNDVLAISMSCRQRAYL